MLWQGFYASPQKLEAAYGEQFCLRMTREFQSVELRADVKVPPQGSHVLPPTCLPFQQRKHIWSQCDVCKRQRDRYNC